MFHTSILEVELSQTKGGLGAAIFDLTHEHDPKAFHQEIRQTENDIILEHALAVWLIFHTISSINETNEN